MIFKSDKCKKGIVVNDIKKEAFSGLPLTYFPMYAKVPFDCKGIVVSVINANVCFREFTDIATLNYYNLMNNQKLLELDSDSEMLYKLFK